MNYLLKFFSHVLIMFLLFNTNLLAVEYAHFDHYSIENGLCSNRIRGLTVDEIGRIWLATDFGLSRFDGYRFKNYKHDEYPELFKDDLLTIKHAGDNEIIVGSFSGLLKKYDEKCDCFIDLAPEYFEKVKYYAVQNFVDLPNHGIFALTNGGGIYKYQKGKNCFSTDFSAFESLSNEYVISLYIDAHNRYWIGGIGKLIVADSLGNRISLPCVDEASLGSINAIIPINHHQIAVTSFGNKLLLFESSSVELSAPQIIDLPFANIMTMLKDSGGRVWFATDGYGLWYSDNLDNKNPNFTQLEPWGVNIDGLHKIYSIAEDNLHNIWIATQNTGLWKYNRMPNDRYFHSSQLGFPKAPCSAFAETPDGQFITSVDGAGLYFISPDLSKYEKHKINNNNILAMTVDTIRNQIALSTWGSGCLCYDINTRTASKGCFVALDNYANNVFSVAQNTDGNFFVGTAGMGLQYCYQSSEWQNVLLRDSANLIYSDDWIFRIMVDGDKKWVVTANTVWLIENNIPKILLPNASLVKTHEHQVFVDAAITLDGGLLVATEQNIIRFNSNGKYLGALDFLPIGKYNNVVRDRSGNFWTASSVGVFMFDIYSQKCKCIMGNDNGNLHFEFMPRSGYCARNGKIYFGDLSGFWCFDANLSRSDECAKPRLSFSDLYFLRVKQKPFSDLLPDGNFDKQRSLKVNYDQADFAIGVDLVDFDGKYNPACCDYRLLGFNDEWIAVDDNMRISFNHLPIGKYELQVRASRINNPESENIISAKIDVFPPWWKTWWARSIFVITILAIAFLVFFQRWISMRREQQLLSKKVEERTLELQIALNEKQRLMSVVAHDLKNPMFGIVNLLNHWLEHHQDKDIDEVCQAATTLQSEMQNLLDWAQNDKSMAQWQITDVNVESVVADVVSFLKNLAMQKNITIQTACHAENYARVDIRALKIILRNLIGNAIKFTTEGGKIIVRTSSSDENFIKISVEDNGVGMSEEMIQKLNSGNQYFSTEGTAAEQGSGLGFGLCRFYVKNNGGQIFIESTENQGTNITFTLPDSHRKVVPENVVITNHTIVDWSILEGNVFLVVDDDKLIRDSLASQIGQFASVIIADNGYSALQKLGTQVPDVVISDVVMPEMSGFELAKYFSESEQLKNVPFIFMSVNNDDNNRFEGLKMGAVDYIPKPFNTSELIMKLANILRIRQQTQNILFHEKNEVQELNPDMKKFMEILEANYDDSSLRIDDLADKMGMSKSTLNRRLRALTGNSPNDLLIQFRMNKARELLSVVNNNLTVSEVSTMVGFNDSSYFCRKFKDVFGRTPSEFSK